MLTDNLELSIVVFEAMHYTKILATPFNPYAKLA